MDWNEFTGPYPPTYNLVLNGYCVGSIKKFGRGERNIRVTCRMHGHSACGRLYTREAYPGDEQIKRWMATTSRLSYEAPDAIRRDAAAQHLRDLVFFE